MTLLACHIHGSEMVVGHRAGKAENECCADREEWGP